MGAQLAVIVITTIAVTLVMLLLRKFYPAPKPTSEQPLGEEAVKKSLQVEGASAALILVGAALLFYPVLLALEGLGALVVG